jgi:NADPH:quinone reductase-like Zn-dependent oxidoreductase/NAD(P)-dependent dehydrogenase (short-subunit alcohol dehydrogenase family)/acyl carrier protein
MILVADTLHATSNLRKTLEHVRQLLAPKGLLILVELTTALRINDFVWGLLKGWWAFSDLDLRPSHPLLSRQKWLELLQNTGFVEVAGISDTEKTARSVRTIFFAQEPSKVDKPPIDKKNVSSSKKPGIWLIFTDDNGIGNQLGEHLRQSGHTPIFVSAGESYQQIDAGHFQIHPEHPEDFRQLFDNVLSDGLLPCRGMLHLWSLNIDTPDSALKYGCFSVLHLVQAWANVDWKESPQLWLITSQTQDVGNSTNCLSVHQSPLWGLGRTIMNEHPGLSCRLVDLSESGSSEEIASLYAELMTGEEENEIALRENARYVHRLTQRSLGDIQPKDGQSPSAITPQNFRLEIPNSKLLDDLTLQEIERQVPGAEEVEIQVIAAGVNFKDVAKTIGLLDEAAFRKMRSGGMLGLECAGIITAVGEGVENFNVGDEVLVFGEHCFSQYILSHVSWVFPKPRDLTFEEAATISLAFLTAHHALNYLCRIGKDDKILIHAAAGGVGLAAIQIAQSVGAETFATAGDTRKRSFLKSLGVPHVMDSRSLAFVDEVKQKTDGKGVNIVLNSLPPNTIDKSMSVLDIAGRFVDISNIYGNARIHLTTFQRGVSFFAFELDQIFREKPEFLLSQFRDILQRFDDKTFTPFPYRAIPISSAVRAFHTKADAKHVGKIVFSLRDSDVKAAPSACIPAKFMSDGTYLMSGGLGGFGIATAEWMVEHGARHLVLMGRSGAASPEAQAAIERMKTKEAEIIVAKADVTKEQDVADILERIRTTMPPLRGVIQAAMVLDDATVLQQTPESFYKAIAPKVNGAWNLHTQTLHDKLDFFIMYSSATAVIGNPGQANYTAANVFLDTLARHRRLQGLPALSVNWGAIADVGYVAKHKNDVRIMGQSRYESLPSQTALMLLGELLRRGAVHTVVAHIDWEEWANMFELGSSPKFSWLIERGSDTSAQGDERQESSGFMQAFRSAESSERLLLLETAVAQLVARVLGMNPSKVDHHRSFADMGVDSLMTVELINRIKTEIGIELNTVEVMSMPSISKLAPMLLEKFTASDESLTSDIDEMSEEELDALLEAEMETA